MRGQLWIVAAPSGGGKTTLIREVIEALKHNVVESVSHTTRPARMGEEHGKHYFFVSPEQFKKMVDAGDFLEHAEVFGNCYGTSNTEIESRLSRGIDVILNIDWQGARRVRSLRPDVRTVFLLPPSIQILRSRLTHRGLDDAEVVAERMRQASEQISHYDEFDYLIVNDDLRTATLQLQSLILAARLERQRCQPDHQTLIDQLLA
ncbi:MAG: guanylate kinase [Cardiobacteriaceae bacterium]|nr:guanylate kinase [Cardiobacteriaceae bacterium]